MSKKNSFSSKSLRIAVTLFIIGCVFNKLNQPLPDDFEQPWKYRLICFGAEMANHLGHYLESFGLVHRVNITRFSYHFAIGAFNIRDPNDNMQIMDEQVDHLSIRIYRPYKALHNNTDYVAPTILFYHGGGYFVGSADTLEPVTYLMAKHTNFTVIYIEYRLIPEHKFPAAQNDSLSTTLHLINNHQKYNIDVHNLILMGDSAGGNLATVISQKLSADYDIKVKMQILIYPLLQMFDFTLPSYRINLPKRVLGNIDHDKFLHFIHYFTGVEIDETIFSNGHTGRHHKDSVLSQYVNTDFLPYELRNHNLESVTYLNDTEGKYSALCDILLSPDVSPLLVSDEYLAKHTPENTFLLTTEIDILRDDGYIYAHRLRKLGLSIEHKHYKNLFHGVFGLLHGPIGFDVARSLVHTVVENIKQVVVVVN